MKVGFPSLELTDLLAYSPVVPPNYPQEPCLKFFEYRSSVSTLLSNFFEDIVTLHEKVLYLEQILSKSLKDVSKADVIADDLKSSITNKLAELTAGFADGLIQDRAGIIRKDTSAHDTEIPNDLNLEYVQQYIRNKLSSVLPEIYKGFYKAPAGPNDGKVVSLLQKVGRLEEFLNSFTPDNALSRVSIHYLELVHVLFSVGASREEITQRIPMLMHLDMRQLLENVVQGGGRQWMSNPAIISASVLNRDVVIDKIKEMAEEQPQPKMLNLDNLFRLKMVRDKVEMRHELLNHIHKGL